MSMTNDHRSFDRRSRRIHSAAATLALAATLPLVAPLVPTAEAGPADTVSLAADVKTGGTGSDPTGLLEVGGTLYFAATQGDRELWKYDGTGHSLVRDINSGAGSSDPRELTKSSASVFFFSATGFGGRELWRSNGTASGTAQVGEVNAGSASSLPTELTMVGSTLFFAAYDGTDRELWKSDGTLAGTVQVKDIAPGGASGDPKDLVAVGSTLFFTATDAGASSREVYKSDGTAAGTVRVKDIVPGAAGSFPSRLTKVGSNVFFSATSAGAGSELWRSDGTSAGTVRVVSPNLLRVPLELTNVGGTLFFSARTTAQGTELWKSNGTAAGTVLVKNIVPGDQSSEPTELAAIGGRLFFQAGPETDRELWTSNGTAAGTVLVKEINAAGSSSPTELTEIAGTAYFAATDSTHGRELWRSDGTAGGTVRVGDVAAGAASSAPTYLTASGGQLFMSADDGATFGREVWGTTDSIAPNTSIISGPAEGSTTSDAPITLGFASDDLPSTFRCRFTLTAPGQQPGTPPAFGSCSSANSHTLTLVPASDTRVTFEVRATDAAGNVDPTPASRTFTVVAPDAPPVAVNDELTVLREIGLPAALDVLANDTDVDGGPIRIESVTQPTNGSVEIVDGGASLSYEPSRQYCNDSGAFTYTLNGGSTATVRVTVLCGDSPPAAYDDDISVVRESGPSLLDVLANDRNVDGGPIVIESVGRPRHGSVEIVDSGSRLSYEPDRDFCTDSGSFTYTLNGGSTATVMVRVSCGSIPVDQAPVAVDDSATVLKDAEATEIDVLANDTDADGGPMVVESVTQPFNGAAAISGSGSGLTYTPNRAYCNDTVGAPSDRPGPPDTFTYTLNGGSVATVSVRVTCTPEPVDLAPVAVDDAATVAQDVEATEIDVLANDTDADGGPVVVESVTQPVNGAVAITGSGSGLTYTPNHGYCNDAGAADTFTYTLNGGSTGTVEMSVTCVPEVVDQNPVAVDDAATVAQDVAAKQINVLANDTDADGGPVVVESVTQPVNGAVAITGSGSGLTYAPNSKYCNDGEAPDTFTYTLNGGSTAAVAVKVICDTLAVDKAPVAVDDAATIPQDAEATEIDVLGNDTDADGGLKLVESVTQPANGTVAINGSGSALTYAPDSGYCNDTEVPDTFTYTLNRGSVATVAMTVTCEPEPVDLAPVAVDDASTVAQDAEATEIDVLANDTDADGGPMVVESVTQPANGTVAITGSGSGLSYAPSAGYCNKTPSAQSDRPGPPDTFTYTLNGGSAATVDMTVTCEAVAPEPVDTTAPETEITGATNLLGLSLWLSQKGTFTFTSTEPGSTFECRVDEADFKPCTSPHAVTIPFGTHAFAVRAIDPAGNVDPTPATSSVLVAGLF